MPDWVGSCLRYLWLAMNVLALIYFFFGQPDETDDPELVSTSKWGWNPEVKRSMARSNEREWKRYHRKVNKAKWEDVKDRWGCLGWLLTGWLVYFTFRYMLNFYGIG